MKIKIFVIGILSAAVILFVVAVVLDNGRADRRGMSVAQTTSEASATSPDRSTMTPKGDAAAPEGPESESPESEDSKPDPGSVDDPKKTPAPNAEATRPTWDPQPTESESALEVPEQTAPTEFSLPDSVKREPVLKKSPKTGVSEGKLTPDFPADAVPLPPSTSVVQSSVERQSELVLVGVEGRSSSSVEDVLDFYNEHFADREWLTIDTAPAEGTTQLQGALGEDSITVTIRQLPTGATSVIAAGVFKIEG